MSAAVDSIPYKGYMYVYTIHSDTDKLQDPQWH